jgi:hypothetical protein
LAEWNVFVKSGQMAQYLAAMEPEMKTAEGAVQAGP